MLVVLEDLGSHAGCSRIHLGVIYKPGFLRFILIFNQRLIRVLLLLLPPRSLLHDAGLD